jgi:hypothetical protein
MSLEWHNVLVMVLAVLLAQVLLVLLLLRGRYLVSLEAINYFLEMYGRYLMTLSAESWRLLFDLTRHAEVFLVLTEHTRNRWLAEVRNGHTDTGSDKNPLPRFWDMFPFMLSKKTRTRVYEPACEELKEDYLNALRRFTKPGERRCLKLIFTYRTIVLVVQSLAAGIGDRAMRLVEKVLPILLGRWLGS